MQLLQAAEAPARLLAMEELLAELDQMMAGAWQDRHSDIATILLQMRSEGRALRYLIKKTTVDGAPRRLQGAQSFMIADQPDYFLRVNLWFPQGGLSLLSDRYRRYLSIDELHNHDFNFFTLCLSGPGYTSLFYREDEFDPDREVGDRIPLAAPCEVTVSGETVLFVEKEKDYHAQRWPSAITTTMNLIPKSYSNKRVQYVLNPHDLTVRDVVTSQ